MTFEYDGPEWGYCKEPGCRNEAIPCYAPDAVVGDEPDDLLCYIHAPRHHYCAVCGEFQKPLIHDLCTWCSIEAEEEKETRHAPPST